MSCCKLCKGSRWIEEDYYHNKRCPECEKNSKEDLMKWFKQTVYDISITKSNSRKDVVGVLTDNVNHESFTASGSDEYAVLSRLKDMVEGNYKK